MHPDVREKLSVVELQMLDEKTGWKPNELSTGAVFLQRMPSKRMRHRYRKRTWHPLGARLFGWKLYTHWNHYLTDTKPDDLP